MTSKQAMYSEQLDGKQAASLNKEDLFTYLKTTPEGLSGNEAYKRMAFYGKNTIEDKKQNVILKFFSYFWGPIAWMIEIAAILSAIVRHTEDLVIILVLLIFNAVVGFWQEYQASSAIEQLKRRLALKTRVKRDGKWITIDAEQLVPGDIVTIRLGDIVPADIILLSGGYLSIDQSVLTGESLPVDKGDGELIYSGSIAKQGEVIGVVVATGASTYFGRTAKLVSSVQQVSHFQKAIINIGDYLILMSLALVAILVLVGLDRHLPVMELVQFSLILTVASIPVALPAVMSVTMAVGAIRLAKLKAIVSRLESIEELAGMDILCCDKTGTLTRNKLSMGEKILFSDIDEHQLILIAALASNREHPDAIDAAILSELKNKNTLESYTVQQFIPFDPVRKRTEVIINDSEGNRFHVSKGAPQVILELCHPDQQMYDNAESIVNELAQKGYRSLAVARTNAEGHWILLGILALYDPPREDARQTIQEAGIYGVNIKMVTGDNTAIAREIARELGLGGNILKADQLVSAKDNQSIIHKATHTVEQADGFAEVFPEHKFWIVKELQARQHLVGMTGDGVNDAPALKQADIGIAVSGATDAARAAADLVLTGTGLKVIINAIEEARRIFERMTAYAIYRITETIRIMLFMVLAMLVYNFYPVTAIMIILLALLNDLPILMISKDNTHLPLQPVIWEMNKVLTVATVLGVLGVIETFLLLIVAKNYLQVSIHELQTIIFLKLAIAGHLTLFVARTRHAFWTQPYPSPLLLVAIISTQLLAVMIARFGWYVTAISWEYIGFIWSYCLFWVFIEDGLKLIVYRRLEYSEKSNTTLNKKTA